MLRYIHRKKQYLKFCKTTTWDHNSKCTSLSVFKSFLLSPPPNILIHITQYSVKPFYMLQSEGVDIFIVSFTTGALNTQLRATWSSHKCRGTKEKKNLRTSARQQESCLEHLECWANQTCRLLLFILFKPRSHSPFLNGECWKPVKNCSFDDLFEECDI